MSHDSLTKHGRRDGTASGQTTMFLLLLVIVIFAGTAIFLLTFAKTISQADYMNLYVHNLLLVLMRSDTGYTDPECKLVSDTLSCAFFTPGHICGTAGPDCLSLANETVSEYIDRFSMIKKSYGYLLVVEPYDFRRLDENGEPFSITIGDPDIASLRQAKYAANEQIRRKTATGVYSLDARLFITTR